MVADTTTWPRARRVGVAVSSGAVGVVAGLAGAIVHRHAVRPGGVLLPWGLVLTLAAVFAVTVVAGRLAGGPGALGVGLGWVVALLWLQQVRPEGDYVFASDFLGNAYVFGGMVTVALAVVRGMTVSRIESPTP
jgi:Family of unknown function (DUF6113)